MSHRENSNRPPRWLRLLLFALLIGFVSLAFYLNFRETFDQMKDDAPAGTQSEPR